MAEITVTEKPLKFDLTADRTSRSEGPSLRDLYERVTPRYAASWKIIGTLLGLSIGELNAIEAGYPTNVKWCCNKMLEKWLEVDTVASWEKLSIVLESPALFNNGML